MNLKGPILSLFLLLSIIGYAQDGTAVVPVQFLNFPSGFHFINPAFSAADSSASAISGNRMNFGSFKIFRTHFLALNKAFASDGSGNRRHGIGFLAYTDREGEYISSNRFYLNYAYSLPVGAQTNISTGLSLGMANRLIEATAISAGSSIVSPDGNVGAWIYNTKGYFGASVNQLFNTKVRSLSESLVFRRHFNVSAGRGFDLLPFISWKLSGNLRWLDTKHADLDLMSVFLIQEVISAGVNYRHKRGIVILMGFENLSFKGGNHLGAAYFSYNLPFKRYIVGAPQTYEITLSYKIL